MRTIVPEPRAIAGVLRITLCIAASAVVLAATAAQAAPAGDFILPDASAALPAPLATALAAVDEARIRGEIDWLAHPDRQGRGLGSEGLSAAANHLAAALAAAGVRPFGDEPGAPGASAWFQSVPLRTIDRPAGELRAGGRLLCVHGRDCVLPGLLPGRIAATAVDAGHGLREPALGHDDYAGLEVRGRFAVFRDGLPDGAAWREPAVQARHASGDPADPAERYEPRLEVLHALGARGAIALEEGLAARLASGEEPAWPAWFDAVEAPREAALPLVRADASVGTALRAAAASSTPLVLSTGGRVRATSSRNVVGILPARAGAGSSQALVIGAHMDHLGMPGGRVHPGGDDNASGVAALLEVARALAAAPEPPRRPVVFVFWTGEELGHFGSRHWARSPRWPLAATRAYVNLDMIGHPWLPAELATLAAALGEPAAADFLARARPAWFAEPGVDAGAPWLADLLAQAGRASGMALHLDRADGRQGGSDYRAFARAAVPWVRFFGNFFPEYHRPGDTAESVDAAQVARMARLVLATAWLVASSDDALSPTPTP